MNIHSIAPKNKFYTYLKKLMRYLSFCRKDDIITWTAERMPGRAVKASRLLRCGVSRRAGCSPIAGVKKF